MRLEAYSHTFFGISPVRKTDPLRRGLRQMGKRDLIVLLGPVVRKTDPLRRGLRLRFGIPDFLFGQLLEKLTR